MTKTIDRKTQILDEVQIDIDDFSNKPSHELINEINYQENYLKEKYAEFNERLSILSVTKHYGYDGGFDFYLVAQIEESDSEYQARVDEIQRKVKEKKEAKIKLLEEKLKKLKNS